MKDNGLSYNIWLYIVKTSRHYNQIHKWIIFKLITFTAPVSLTILYQLPKIALKS